jgi:hypothetical protein
MMAHDLHVPRIVRVQVLASRRGVLVTARPFGRKYGRFAALGVKTPQITAKLNTSSARFSRYEGGEVT